MNSVHKKSLFALALNHACALAIVSVSFQAVAFDPPDEKIQCLAFNSKQLGKKVSSKGSNLKENLSAGMSVAIEFLNKKLTPQSHEDQLKLYITLFGLPSTAAHAAEKNLDLSSAEQLKLKFATRKLREALSYVNQGLIDGSIDIEKLFSMDESVVKNQKSALLRLDQMSEQQKGLDLLSRLSTNYSLIPSDMEEKGGGGLSISEIVLKEGLGGNGTSKKIDLSAANIAIVQDKKIAEIPAASLEAFGTIVYRIGLTSNCETMRSFHLSNYREKWNPVFDERKVRDLKRSIEKVNELLRKMESESLRGEESYTPYSPAGLADETSAMRQAWLKDSLGLGPKQSNSTIKLIDKSGYK